MQHMRQTLYLRWARRLIECYPAGWRQRYAEEMLLILEDSQPTLKTICNLFLHLFDAYLHQEFVKGRTPYMLQKMRSNELAIYGATLIFFVAWFVVQHHFVDASQSLSLVGDSFSFTPSLLLNIIHSVSDLLPLFILFGGLPILLAASWQALEERKVGAVLFCLLSLMSPPVTLVIALLKSPDWFTPFGLVISQGISLALIAFAVQRVAPTRRITHYALSLATLIPLVMLVGLAALLSEEIPHLVTLSQAEGFLFYLLRDSFLILIMVGALFLALLALRKGFQAKRAIQATL